MWWYTIVILEVFFLFHLMHDCKIIWTRGYDYEFCRLICMYIELNEHSLISPSPMPKVCNPMNTITTILLCNCFLFLSKNKNYRYNTWVYIGSSTMMLPDAFCTIMLSTDFKWSLWGPVFSCPNITFSTPSRVNILIYAHILSQSIQFGTIDLPHSLFVQKWRFKLLLWSPRLSLSVKMEHWMLHHHPSRTRVSLVPPLLTESNPNKALPHKVQGKEQISVPTLQSWFFI